MLVIDHCIVGCAQRLYENGCVRKQRLEVDEAYSTGAHPNRDEIRVATTIGCPFVVASSSWPASFCVHQCNWYHPRRG